MVGVASAAPDLQAEHKVCETPGHETGYPDVVLRHQRSANWAKKIFCVPCTRCPFTICSPPTLVSPEWQVEQNDEGPRE